MESFKVITVLYLALGSTDHFNLKLLLKFCNWSSYQVQIFLAISTSRIFCGQVKETSRRPVGLLITIEGVISMTVFLTGTHFLSGRPSLHAPPAAPPRRPDSRIPADNGDKCEVCRRGAFDGRSANNGFFRNQHKFLVFTQDNKS